MDQHSTGNNNTLKAYPAYVWLMFPIITRIIVYLSNRTLSQDEVSLAINFVERNWQQLMEPLSNSQSAPPAFLLTVNMIVSALGINEFTLRLFPLLLGLWACVLLFYLVRMLSPHLIPLMMIWFATSNILLRYSTEFKQYSGDVFLTLLLLCIAVQIINIKSRQWIIAWGIASAIAVWFSHPSVFVIAGVGLCTIVILFKNGYRMQSYQMIAACAFAAINFLLVYSIFYTQVVAETDLAATMQAYWQGDFFKFNWIWFVRYPFLLFQFTSGFGNTVLLILTIFGFFVGLQKMEKKYLAILLIPIFITLMASSLELYPLRNRFLLFMLPGIMIVCARGLVHFYRLLHGFRRYLAYVAALLLALLYFVQTDLRQMHFEVRPAFEYIKSISPKSPIYVDADTAHVAGFYDFEYAVIQSETDQTTDGEHSIYYILADAAHTPLQLTDWQKVSSFKGVTIYCDGCDRPDLME